ncbi:hypothetical protein ABR737_05205 [Streptomyces sp. Edi2]|uniref:hypothetical protein n=1 Tax=Streptomyces sp. Edi2 TaxID=3162528 RepID=UPI003306818B
MASHRDWCNTCPVLQELLDHLAGDGRDIAAGSALDEKSVTAATRPLVEADWKHGIDDRWMRWTNLSEDAGVTTLCSQRT